ncbi:MAG: hypothetical protein HFG33_01305 [Bacilli bacterium]|nr:hypothetical protein [Bacilli bacterium]
MTLEYLYDFGLDSRDVEEICEYVDEDIFTELGLFENIVKENIQYMKDFGVSNFSQVVLKFPDIFLRDADSFKNIFSKFDRDDLIQKVEKNPAVFKKMVEFVDNN